MRQHAEVCGAHLLGSLQHCYALLALGLLKAVLAVDSLPQVLVLDHNRAPLSSWRHYLQKLAQMSHCLTVAQANTRPSAAQLQLAWIKECPGAGPPGPQLQVASSDINTEGSIGQCKPRKGKEASPDRHLHHLQSASTFVWATVPSVRLTCLPTSGGSGPALACVTRSCCLPDKCSSQ